MVVKENPDSKKKIWSTDKEISKLDLLAKIVAGWKPLTISPKPPSQIVRQGPDP